jgi:hypothetical protein
MKSFSSLTAAALFSLAMPGAQACALALSGGPPSVTIEYNPFEPGTARALVSLQLKNSGNKACDGALAFFHGGRPVAKGLGSDGVAFGVKNYLTGGDLLGQDAVPPVLVRNPFLPATNLTPGETRSVNVVVTVAPGQIVHPGLFSDSVDIVTYQGSGTSMTRTANQVPMSVQVSVETVMSVNIAGGGQSATLDFGVLAVGTARSAMIQARSNQGFRFAASSENGGVMKLEPPAGDGIAWQVPYTIKINNGSDLTLRTNQTVSFAKGATSIAGTNVPVEVKTGDPSNQRAGRYKDVIVIKIEALP